MNATLNPFWDLSFDGYSFNGAIEIISQSLLGFILNRSLQRRRTNSSSLNPFWDLSGVMIDTGIPTFIIRSQSLLGFISKSLSLKHSYPNISQSLLGFITITLTQQSKEFITLNPFWDLSVYNVLGSLKIPYTISQSLLGFIDETDRGSLCNIIRTLNPFWDLSDICECQRNAYAYDLSIPFGIYRRERYHT